jgi:hypothetical protein
MYRLDFNKQPANNGSNVLFFIGSLGEERQTINEKWNDIDSTNCEADLALQTIDQLIS